MSLNRVILQGNLTRDCETIFSGSGTAVVKFGMAINRQWTDAAGNKTNKTVFVDVTMFGKRGEAFARFHGKGKPALIEGRLELDEWSDKQTSQKRQKLYVVAEGWEFAGSGSAPSPVGDEPEAGRPAPADETAF